MTNLLGWMIPSWVILLLLVALYEVLDDEFTRCKQLPHRLKCTV
ncbi:hypothetical protein [Nocardia goodfellowii]|uniref:Uncharacterized protein n=1 Tax=Nocardia goodfellowii TaxID=882446 RepID=A0ABS4Q8K6_9NOCA|nr:hypothetical protein [Nocardia goodfellowii]MBP2188025.1 hypothetical protein [Nocardia goodfellowii]